MPSMVGTVGEEHARKAVWPASKAGAKVCAVGRASSSQKRTGCSLIFKDPPLDLSMISLFFFFKGLQLFVVWSVLLHAQLSSE